MSKGFLFANNLMLDTGKSLKRTDNVNETAFRKFDYLIEKSEDQDLVLVLCGEVFTKNFCIKTLSECLDRLKQIECLVLADKSQMNGSTLNPNSTLGILDRAGILRAVYGNEISKRIEIETSNGEVTFGIVGNRHDIIDDEIVVDQGLFSEMRCIYIGDFKADLNFTGTKNSVKPYEVQSCTLVVATGQSRDCLEAHVGKTKWMTAGNALRQHASDESVSPSYAVYKPNEDVYFGEIPFEEFVFDHAGLDEQTIEIVTEKSDFARRLKEVCTEDEAINGGVNQTAIDKLCEERNVSLPAREVIYSLEKKYHASK